MMKDGFLGYQTSFMLDFVVCALIAIVPMLMFSLWKVKFRKQYQQHRKLQLFLGVVLLVAVTAFEVDLRFIQGGWRNIVQKSSANETVLAERIQAAAPWMKFHLVFAITTPFLWAITLGFALLKFDKPTQPGSHSRWHKVLGWASAIDITMTAITGLIFYYVAFVNV